METSEISSSNTWHYDFKVYSRYMNSLQHGARQLVVIEASSIGALCDIRNRKTPGPVCDVRVPSRNMGVSTIRGALLQTQNSGALIITTPELKEDPPQFSETIMLRS